MYTLPFTENLEPSSFLFHIGPRSTEICEGHFISLLFFHVEAIIHDAQVCIFYLLFFISKFKYKHVILMHLCSHVVVAYRFPLNQDGNRLIYFEVHSLSQFSLCCFVVFYVHSILLWKFDSSLFLFTISNMITVMMFMSGVVSAFRFSCSCFYAWFDWYESRFLFVFVHTWILIFICFFINAFMFIGSYIVAFAMLWRSTIVSLPFSL